MNQRDKILVAEAKSGIQQICHILGNDRTAWVLNMIDYMAAEIDEVARGGSKT